MRNGDPVNCRIAAYNIARHYELAKNYKKALFYARIALERSEALGRRDWLASSHNLIGNTLLAESLIEQACAEYEQALELMPAEPTVAHAMILDNLATAGSSRAATARATPSSTGASPPSAPRGSTSTKPRSGWTSASPISRPAAISTPGGTASRPCGWPRSAATPS